MARRGETKEEKMETNMSAMIDVVFQLLIFFMLTLKIVEPEGDFNINMPASGAPSQNQDMQLPDIKVRLEANQDGTLRQIVFGRNALGNGPDAFKRLNLEIAKLVNGGADPMAKDMEVEINADYNLHFSNVVNAVGACTGRLNENGEVVKYIEKIKFAPPNKPGA